MPYKVKAIYYTLQGEGARTGRPAVFVRFAGCNLWSGREEDRASAACRFCDTDFVGGQTYASADAVAAEALSRLPSRSSPRYVVLTGGEPALQADDALVRAFASAGWEVAIETNGTVPISREIHWVTVSPKAGTELRVRQGDEIKVVFPQDGLDMGALASLDFLHRYIQPMDGPDRDRNTQFAARYCLEHPEWWLSLQVHKVAGVE